MGLLSKKTVTCKSCGKEFQTRVPLLQGYCTECEEKRLAEHRRQEEEKKRQEEEKRKIEDNVLGYIGYADEYLQRKYSEDELRQIAQHRDSILEKYRQLGGITREELKVASIRYKELSDEECFDVIMRIGMSIMTTTIGAASSSNFFVPTLGSRMVVDAKDVFAVGFTSDSKLSAGLSEVILCAVFTNDPYVPAFPMVFLGKTGMFEMKSKKGRQGVKERFEAMCPNLTYPVEDLKELKKTVKKEDVVRGKLEKKFMLSQIGDASISFGLFNTNKLSSTIYGSTQELLEEYGYIVEDTVNDILHMDEKKVAKFWHGKMDELSERM